MNKQTKPNHGSADYLMVSPCGGMGIVTAQLLWNFGEQVAIGGGFSPNTLVFMCIIPPMHHTYNSFNY